MNMRAMTGIIRGVLAASVLGIFGYMAYGLWNMANMGFGAYFHCKIVMMELGYAPNTCPFPWSCVFLMVLMVIPISVGIWLACVILSAFT